MKVITVKFGPRWIIPMLVICLASAGCSLFQAKPAPRVADIAAPSAPELPQPVATHRFDVDATTEILGYVQKTVVGKDDTFSDVARRWQRLYQAEAPSPAIHPITSSSQGPPDSANVAKQPEMFVQ
jgi:hypothetical protein